MPKAIAVVISDIHFNLHTLPIASKALSSAVNTANDLNLPLVIAGDLNDTKAIIRAEVANKLIDILRSARTPVYILVGNHDRINEREHEHGLNYLKPYANIVDEPSMLENEDVFLVPYFNNPQLIKTSDVIPYGVILIMHQGFQGALMGDYVLDKTSISPEVVKNHTVISGHYHKHQTIGTVTY